MVILYSHNTPEEVLAKCSKGEITPEDAITALRIMRDYYERVIRGGSADRNYPITPEEAAKKIGAAENAIETLWTILHPPKLPIDLTEARNKLREIRDRCITGGYTKKEALALFDQTWLDFENDTIFKADMNSLQPQIRQIIDECKDMDIINRIRVEIEEIPEPSPPQAQTETPETAQDTQAPAQGTAAASKTDPAAATTRWLKNKERQYIIKHTEPDTPVMLNGALEHIEPSISEWRIAKPAAFIYRELCGAAERGEIQFTKEAIADFMINNLKQKGGGDITHDLLTKAEKRRQNQTK
jgi:hypothetical protein